MRHAHFFKVLFLSCLLVVFGLVHAAKPAQALDGCEQNFVIDPSSAAPGDRVDVYVQNITMNESDTVTIDVNGSRAFGCSGDCGGYLMEYRVPGDAPDNQVIQFSIVHIDGAGGRCETTKTLTVNATGAPACSPLGLQSVSPTEGGTSDTFVFTGCLGVYNASENPAVIIKDASSNIGVQQIVLRIGTTAVNADGTFQVSRIGLAPGIWSGQLFISQNAQAGAIDFAVEGLATTCTEPVICQGSGGQPGTKNCIGSRPPGGVCTYTEDACSDCLYCGDNQCNNNETAISCPNDCAVTECGNNRCESGETPLTCPQDCLDQGDDEDEEDPEIDAFEFCKQVPTEQFGECTSCMGAGVGSNSEENVQKLYTAVGCIRVDEKGLVEDLVRLLLGIGGGVALLSILAAAFLIGTSQGDTNRVKQARELMTAAVSGLFFMIFSVIVLQFVGVTILRIPGLG